MNEEQIREKVLELTNQHIEGRDKVRALINEIKEKRALSDQLKKERDSLNAQVKEAIEKAKQHLAKRDEMQAGMKTEKDKTKEITSKIQEKAAVISKVKAERDKHNKEAKGYLENLQAQFTNSLRTLMGMDLSLKNELIMVEMIFELQGRIAQKIEADKLHKAVQETYQDLKQTEGQLQSFYSEMHERIAQSQEEHRLAHEMFAKKDELRKEAQEAHNKLLDNNKLIKDLSQKIDASKAALDQLQAKIQEERAKLLNFRKYKAELEKKDKLEKAKVKMEKTGKIGIDDLRLLIESGELKIDKK